MIHFLQPEWLWLLALLPLALLWRGRKGRVAAVEYSNIGLARPSRRSTRAARGQLAVAAADSCRRPYDRRAGATAIGPRPHSVTASGIDIMLGLDVSGSMQALDFKIDGQRVNRIDVVKSVVSKFIDERPDDRIGICGLCRRALPGQPAHARS